jgi:gas vesicle protein
MGWPDLESFLIGAIVGAIVPIIALLYLTWKGLVQW